MPKRLRKNECAAETEELDRSHLLSRPRLELQQWCVSLGLTMVGNKRTLTHRIIGHIQQAAVEEPPDQSHAK